MADKRLKELRRRLEQKRFWLEVDLARVRHYRATGEAGKVLYYSTRAADLMMSVGPGVVPFIWNCDTIISYVDCGMIPAVMIEFENKCQYDINEHVRLEARPRGKNND